MNWLPGPAPVLVDPQGCDYVYPKKYPENVYPLYVAGQFKEPRSYVMNIIADVPKFVGGCAQG